MRPRMSRIFYRRQVLRLPDQAARTPCATWASSRRSAACCPTSGCGSVRRRTRRPSRAGIVAASAGGSTATSSRPTTRSCGACRSTSCRPTGPRSASRTCRSSTRCTDRAASPKRNKKRHHLAHRGVPVPEVRPGDDVGALPRPGRGAGLQGRHEHPVVGIRHEDGRAVAVDRRERRRRPHRVPLRPRHLVDADLAAAPGDGPAGPPTTPWPRPTTCATATSSPSRSSCPRRYSFPDNWIYIHSPEVQVGRIQNFGSWSPVPGEGRPHLPRPRVLRVRGRRHVEHARRGPDRAGQARARDPRPGRSRRRSRPATSCACRRRTRSTTSTTRPTWPRIVEWLEDCAPNVHPVGRNGMHRYNNQDHSMLHGHADGREHPRRAAPRHLGASTSRRSTTRSRAATTTTRCTGTRGHRPRRPGDPARAPTAPITRSIADRGPPSRRPRRASGRPDLGELIELARRAGCAAVHVLAWRDLDDVEAGGSEVHAAEVARHLGRGRHRRHDAHARTPQGHPPEVAARRLPGRPHAAAATWSSRRRCSAEVARPARARATASSRSGTACRSSARCGRAARRSSSCTTCTATCGAWCSRSRAGPLRRGPRAHGSRPRSTGAPRSSRCRSRRASELVDEHGLPPEQVTRRAARHRRPVHARRRTKSPTPAGRRRRPAHAAQAVRRADPGRRRGPRARAPTSQLVIVGDGYERERLEALDRATLDAEAWVHLRRATSPTTSWSTLYQRAWVRGQRLDRRGLGHDPHRGRGLRDAGRRHRHRRAPRRGRTTASSGLLADDDARARRAARPRCSPTPTLRGRLAEGALEHAAALTWDATAIGALAPLADEALRRRRPA